ncbi:MAG: hypothetical protein H0W70_05060 [Actinobacteria bacterium]|nr:hypothetical protein [Actinomycetota bacterium]
MIAVHAVLAGLTWDPQIRGAAIIITAILILPGSVYLLLATNLGARIGFLVAVAGLTGWISVMSIIWMVYGIGLKGREPSWKPREVVTGELSASTVDAVRGFPRGWKLLPGESPELADAQAAVDKLIVKPSGAPTHGASGGSDALAKKFPALFGTTEEYVRIAGYRKGGDNELFKIGHHKFFFRHSPHWEVVQVRPVLKQPDLGGTPPPPVADVREPLVSVVMVRDLGSIRFPPFVIALSSLLVFGIVCNVLHRRDQQIWAAQAAAKEESTRVPEPARV